MGLYSDDSEQARAYDQVVNALPKAKLSHELIADAASYEAAKVYEKHVRANGAPDSIQKAKELLMSFAGAFIDRVVESKGLDYIDKMKARSYAHEQLTDVISQDY